MRFVRLTLMLAAAGLMTASAPARADNFSTSAAVALVQDYDSGTVLYEKNADDPMVPASTAKLLTAEIVFHELKEGRLQLDDMFEVSEKAWREGGAHSHGPAMFLAIHSHVRIEDLLRGLIIQSGNDAAMTLAEGMAGTEENFAEVMNKRAAELGMAHSHFTDPRGKYDPSQHATARDMALLATRLIRDYPEYYHYFGEKEFTWNKIRQLNRNPLLTMDIGADGLKAGDVKDGGFALVGSAVQDGQRLIIVLNGLKSAADRVQELRKLFDYGFHSFDRRILYEAGDKVGTADVYGGRDGHGSPRDRPADNLVRSTRRKRQARGQDRLYGAARGAGQTRQGGRPAEDLARRHAGHRRSAQDRNRRRAWRTDTARFRRRG